MAECLSLRVAHDLVQQVVGVIHYHLVRVMSNILLLLYHHLVVIIWIRASIIPSNDLFISILVGDLHLSVDFDSLLHGLHLHLLHVLLLLGHLGPLVLLYIRFIPSTELLLLLLLYVALIRLRLCYLRISLLTVNILQRRVFNIESSKLLLQEYVHILRLLV